MDKTTYKRLKKAGLGLYKAENALSALTDKLDSIIAKEGKLQKNKQQGKELVVPDKKVLKRKAKVHSAKKT